MNTPDSKLALSPTASLHVASSRGAVTASFGAAARVAITASFGAAALLCTLPASAQDPASPAPNTPTPAASPAPSTPEPAAAPAPAAPNPDTASPAETKPRGAFVVGAKVGGLAPFDGLSPFVVGTLELGYVLPWLNRGIAGLVDVSYTAPSATGEQADPRVPGGKYTWNLVQHELTIQPTILYRYTGLGRLVPFVGIGARIYLMKSVVTGKAGTAPIGETDESSTQIGGAIPLGVELQIGPGALLGELLFEIGTLDHSITGNTHTGGGTLNVGYRFLL